MNRLMRRNRRRRVVTIILTIAVIFFFTYQFFKAIYGIEDLKEKKILTTGIITNVHKSQRNTGSGIDYKFFVNNTEYNGSTGYMSLPTEFCETLIGKNFPVAYSPEHINNNVMLITEFRFKMYGMEQPDSLKWVEKYVQK
jgi:hypothetical protein